MTRLKQKVPRLHFPRSVGLQVLTAKVFSFGSHGSCGELSAAAELVTATPIYTSVYDTRESQSDDA